MAQERKNPLPPGRYWIDVFDPHRRGFKDWLDKNASTISVEQTKEYETNTPLGTFYLFTTSEPVQWEGPGFPTIADQGVQSQEDTAQRPPPEKEGLEKLEEIVENTGSFLAMAAILGIGYVAYKILK